MNKPVKAVLIGNAEIAFKELNLIVEQQIQEGKNSSQEMQLLNSIKQKVELIKANPFYGDNVKKNFIPKNFNVQNLWRVELVNFWRMLYTIKGDEIEIICFILEIVDHPNYNKIFGYTKK